MLNSTAVMTDIGSSGIAAAAVAYISSRKLSKVSQSAEERNESREPFVVTSIQIGNATKVIDLLRTGLDELEDSKQRITRDLRDMNTILEQKVQSVTNENKRLIEEMNHEKEESERMIEDLNARIAILKSTLGTMTEGVAGP